MHELICINSELQQRKKKDSLVLIKPQYQRILDTEDRLFPQEAVCAEQFFYSIDIEGCLRRRSCQDASLDEERRFYGITRPRLKLYDDALLLISPKGIYAIDPECFKNTLYQDQGAEDALFLSGKLYLLKEGRIYIAETKKEVFSKEGICRIDVIDDDLLCTGDSFILRITKEGKELFYQKTESPMRYCGKKWGAYLFYSREQTSVLELRDKDLSIKKNIGLAPFPIDQVILRPKTIDCLSRASYDYLRFNKKGSYNYLEDNKKGKLLWAFYTNQGSQLFYSNMNNKGTSQLKWLSPKFKFQLSELSIIKLGQLDRDHLILEFNEQYFILNILNMQWEKGSEKDWEKSRSIKTSSKDFKLRKINHGLLLAKDRQELEIFLHLENGEYKGASVFYENGEMQEASATVQKKIKCLIYHKKGTKYSLCHQTEQDQETGQFYQNLDSTRKSSAFLMRWLGGIK